MKVTIELVNGPYHNASVSKRDMQKNIDVLQDCIDNIDKWGNCSYVSILLDTKSILENIKQQLPEPSPCMYRDAKLTKY